MQNLRFAFRRLLKDPFVTAVAILSLALGIGANAAVFSMFNQILLRPLAVHDPTALVNLSAPGPKPGSNSSNDAGGTESVFSYPMFRDLEKAQTVFDGIAAHRTFGANLSARGQTLNGEGMFVSGSYFPLLGLQPAAGRLLGSQDDRAAGESPVAVLSHAYWQARFGSDPGAVGDTLVVNGQSLTIVGVAPRGFGGTTLGTRANVFVPITLREVLQPSPRRASLDARISYWVYLFARLKPGVSIDQARAAINVPYRSIISEVELPLQRGMTDQVKARFLAKTVGIEPGSHGQSTIPREAQTPLTLLLGVASLVLLIACANIANLLLARSAARTSEMAIRLSIGAGRRHLIGQLLVESCLLAAIGGAAGLVVARWTLDFIMSLLPGDVTNLLQPQLDFSVLLFTAALALGTGLLFGLFPALRSTRPDLVSTLKSQAGQSSGGRAAARFRTTLATTQVALSMVLLVTAGLFIRSLFNVTRVDLGFAIDHLVTFGVSPALNGYAPERSRELFDRIETAVMALPGATGVTSATVPVLAGDNSGTNVTVEGFHAAPGDNTNSSYNTVGSEYFGVLGIPLLAGRDLTRGDAAGSPGVVVNEAFAKRFNPGNPANTILGKRMAPNGGTPNLEIVGLARDAKYSEAKEPVPPLFFQPHRQVDNVRALVFYVKVAGDPEAFLSNIPKLMAMLDPNLPVEGLRTLPEQFRENVFLDRVMTILSAAFASLATLLAAVGLYGVLAYTVVQRTREIGVRMALGATPGRVRLMMLRQMAVMTLIGCAIGGIGALALGRYAEALLFQLKGYDPAVLAGAAIALSIVALSAAAIPAHRASRVDPIRALRYE